MDQIREELVDPAECPVIQIFPKNQARSHRSRGSDMVLEAWILWRSSILSLKKKKIPSLHSQAIP